MRNYRDVRFYKRIIEGEIPPYRGRCYSNQQHVILNQLRLINKVKINYGSDYNYSHYFFKYSYSSLYFIKITSERNID